jgi:predicted component of type VI protein secretion system
MPEAIREVMRGLDPLNLEAVLEIEGGPGEAADAASASFSIRQDLRAILNTDRHRPKYWLSSRKVLTVTVQSTDCHRGTY